MPFYRPWQANFSYHGKVFNELKCNMSEYLLNDTKL